MGECCEKVRYERFSTRIRLPCEGDPSDSFKYDPNCTVGIGVECVVAYTCKKAPEIIHWEITGMNQVGFVFSSEYKVKPNLEDPKKYECTKEGCERAVQYEFDIKYYIWLIVGVGFGVGSSTFAFGTAGWEFDAIKESKHFKTECFCCDDA